MIILVVRDSSGEEIFRQKMDGGQSFLDECGEKGVDLPFSCHAGACMSCAAQITAGHEFVESTAFGDKYIETDDDVILTCVAGPKEEFLTTPEECVVEMQMLM